jgi:hypothetical protein
MKWRTSGETKDCRGLCNEGRLGGDSARISLMGSSAGGNQFRLGMTNQFLCGHGQRPAHRGVPPPGASQWI